MDLLPQQWRRAHLRLQNAKPASIANGSNEFGAGQIRSHRCHYDGGFDPKPLAEARPQHSRSPLDVKKLKADSPPCSGIRVHAANMASSSRFPQWGRRAGPDPVSLPATEAVQADDLHFLALPATEAAGSYFVRAQEMVSDAGHGPHLHA